MQQFNKRRFKKYGRYIPPTQRRAIAKRKRMQKRNRHAKKNKHGYRKSRKYASRGRFKKIRQARRQIPSRPDLSRTNPAAGKRKCYPTYKCVTAMRKSKIWSAEYYAFAKAGCDQGSWLSCQALAKGYGQGRGVEANKKLQLYYRQLICYFHVQKARYAKSRHIMCAKSNH